MQEGEILWTPSTERIERANVTAFSLWLERERGLAFADYRELWRWSVTDLESFWGALWDYLAVEASAPYARVLGRRAMPGAEWFPGARLNYAENVLRPERGGGVALLHASETHPLEPLSWQELGRQVRILATRLRAL
ncbi:MAG: acetyl-coenzyme A synthetase N-terminal domain-containing protein, partial [Steroidobacteraceae bacterium]